MTTKMDMLTRDKIIGDFLDEKQHRRVCLIPELSLLGVFIGLDVFEKNAFYTMEIDRIMNLEWDDYINNRTVLDNETDEDFSLRVAEEERVWKEIRLKVDNIMTETCNTDW
jgi:hypothetical protein